MHDEISDNAFCAGKSAILKPPRALFNHSRGHLPSQSFTKLSPSMLSKVTAWSPMQRLVVETGSGSVKRCPLPVFCLKHLKLLRLTQRWRYEAWMAQVTPLPLGYHPLGPWLEPQQALGQHHHAKPQHISFCQARGTNMSHQQHGHVRPAALTCHANSMDMSGQQH